MYIVTRQFRGVWMTLALTVAAALPAAAQTPEANGGITRAARPSVEDWVLANRRLRVVISPRYAHTLRRGPEHARNLGLGSLGKQRRARLPSRKEW